MAFRFFRRVKIAPGLTLNFSKSGVSMSAGPRGAKLTVGPRGVRQTAGLPGTGLYYTRHTSHGAGGSKRRRTRPAPRPAQDAGALNPGFFQRLLIPKGDRALIDGCRLYLDGNEREALEQFRRAATSADGAFLAGAVAFKQGESREALKHLKTAVGKKRELGRRMAKYGITVAVNLEITGEVSACITPNLQGVMLFLVELYQLERQWADALRCAHWLHRREPDDLLARISLAELLLECYPGKSAACRRVVRLAEGATVETEPETVLLLYKGRALSQLGLLDAAHSALTQALRRRKGRSPELLKAARYERALVREEQGRASLARADMERIFGEDPDYEDVAARLGM